MNMKKHVVMSVVSALIVLGYGLCLIISQVE